MNDSEHVSSQDEGDRDSGPGNDAADAHDANGDAARAPREIGGRKGLDPVRYGDWEKNGRCIDF